MTPGPISEQTDPRDLEAQTNTGRPALSAVSGGEPSTPSPDAGGAKMEGALTPSRPVRRSHTAQSGRATKHVHEFPSEV